MTNFQQNSHPIQLKLSGFDVQMQQQRNSTTFEWCHISDSFRKLLVQKSNSSDWPEFYLNGLIRNYFSSTTCRLFLIVSDFGQIDVNSIKSFKYLSTCSLLFF